MGGRARKHRMTEANKSKLSGDKIKGNCLPRWPKKKDKFQGNGQEMTKAKVNLEISGASEIELHVAFIGNYF